MRMMIINGYLLNLKMDLVLENNVCWLRRGSHWMCGTTGLGFFLLGVNVKINVAICLEQGGSNNREAAMLKDVITTGKIDWLGSFVNLHW